MLLRFITIYDVFLLRITIYKINLLFTVQSVMYCRLFQQTERQHRIFLRADGKFNNKIRIRFKVHSETDFKARRSFAIFGVLIWVSYFLENALNFFNRIFRSVQGLQQRKCRRPLGSKCRSRITKTTDW